MRELGNRGARTALAALVLAAPLLGGCGDRQEPPAGDAPTPTGTPTASPTGSPPASPGKTGSSARQARVVAVLSQSDAGGEPDDAVRLDDRAAVRELTAALDGPGGDALARRVRTARAEAEPTAGTALAGAVVHVGCEVPYDVEVGVEGARATVEAYLSGPTGTVDCLVPVTTVALVEVPDRVRQVRVLQAEVTPMG